MLLKRIGLNVGSLVYKADSRSMFIYQIQNINCTGSVYYSIDVIACVFIQMPLHANGTHRIHGLLPLEVCIVEFFEFVCVQF